MHDVIIAILKQNISVALVEVGTGEILAGQAVTIENKLGIVEPASFKSEALAKVFGLVNDLDKLCKQPTISSSCLNINIDKRVHNL